MGALIVNFVLMEVSPMAIHISCCRHQFHPNKIITQCIYNFLYYLILEVKCIVRGDLQVPTSPQLIKMSLISFQFIF